MKIKARNTLRAKKILNRFSDIIRILLYLLLALLLVGFAAGLIKTCFDFQLFFSATLETAIREILIHAFILLALIEVIRTVLSYLNYGVLKVTFIVDSVLIVMLNEIISSWFRNGNILTVGTLLVIILVLIFVRFMAIRFSPGKKI